MNSPKTRCLELSMHCYRILKRAYPNEFIQEFGEELDQTFERLYLEEFGRAGYFGLGRLWIRILRDTASSAVRCRISKEGHVVRDAVHLSIDDVNARALQLQKKLWGCTVAAYGIETILVLISVRTFIATPNWLKGLGVILTILGVGYQNWSRRRARTARPALDLESDLCVDSYRRLLEHERDGFRSMWRYILPFLPGVVIGWLGSPDFAIPHPTPEQQAFQVQTAIALAAWIFMMTGTCGFVGWREAHRLQREIESLGK